MLFELSFQWVVTMELTVTMEVSEHDCQIGITDLKHMEQIEWMWTPVLAKVVQVKLSQAVTDPEKPEEECTQR